MSVEQELLPAGDSPLSTGPEEQLLPDDHSVPISELKSLDDDPLRDIDPNKVVMPPMLPIERETNDHSPMDTTPID
jgi:hypothetical protein